MKSEVERGQWSLVKVKVKVEVDVEVEFRLAL